MEEKKKKNKKYLIFGIMAFLVVGFGAALLVPYLSNNVVGEINVGSPVTITVDGEEVYTLDLYAGQNTSIESLTEIHIDGLTGHIAENKISNFDGEGISVEYRIDIYPGVFELPVCVVGDDAYFYIGDPTEILNEGSFLSTTTFKTEQDLEPGNYNIESKVIMFDEAACDPVPEPIFTAD